MRRTSLAVSLATLFVLLAAAAVAQEGPVVDASLESIRGGQRALRAERDRRVVVLFYEDRPYVELNEQLKGNLIQFVRRNRLEDRLVVYGIANLADVGDSVPRALVRTMIRPLEERWGAEILLDWDGALRRPPFSFATDAANVGIVDRAGRLVWRHTGHVDRRRTSDFYRALRHAVRGG